METVVDEWLEWYRREREAAFVELLNFSVRACGCQGVVTPEMFRELQNSEIIRRLTENFQEDSPLYPLSQRSQPWRRFCSGFCELLAVLVRRGQHRELRDGFLMDSWIAFLTGLADSQVRAFRHTGTLAALKLLSSLVEVALGVQQQQDNSQRQFEAEKGKDPGRRGTEKLELLQEQRRELREQQQELELLMNGIFKGVFVHRYRDVVPEIRGICMEELGLWVRKFPGSFLTDGHLKYLGWTLHDKHREVRLRCVRALRGIYGIAEMAPSLELFTHRFKPRLVAMAHDEEPEVALEVLRLLRDMDRNMEEVLSDEDCQNIFPVVFVSNRALATAAGEFLFQRLLEPESPGPGPGANRGFFLRLLRFFLGSQLHEHGAYLVDSLWDCAGSRLRDWDTATGMLLGTSLELPQEQALVEILSAAGIRVCRGLPPVGRSLGRKVSSRERREQQEEKSRLSRSLIPVLPQLLEKFSAEPEAVAALLELLGQLELGTVRSARMDKCLEQVLQQIQDLFHKHSRPSPVLSAASRALRALCDPELSLHGLGDIARGRLGDALGDRCHLQVTELLQAASPDEEDVYGLAATLRRLWALFSDHDLTPWALFGPLSQLLRRALDTGEVPAEVTVPAISCIFFHLFWELSRIPESETLPPELHSRISSFLSLCQSCLSEPDPGVRERAFLVLSDLLVLLGPRQLPEPALQAQLGVALEDLVFQEREQEHEGDEAAEWELQELQRRRALLAGFCRLLLIPKIAEWELQELQRRRALLAGFCRLLLQGLLEPRAGADVFKRYCKFYGDFGDIIRETLRGTRSRDRAEWARTVLLSLQQLFTELLLQEGPALRGLPEFGEIWDSLRGLPEFGEIRDLGRRLALFFSLQHPRGRQELLQLHREKREFEEIWELALFFSLQHPRGRQELLQLHSQGIQFSLQPPPEPQIPGIPGGLPLNLPFLEVLSEFSPRLPRPDRSIVLSLLERSCRERGLGPDFGADLGDFGAPLLCYRRSLSAPETPPGPPRAKRPRSSAPPAPAPGPPTPI
ncbi:cohesin subunit SA-3-like [Catharus ustulatus]|uniref:cohesin subunit SA-3-like n=1 Tax=Catharus ustulatus TaxID=91951 RepID=UPI001408CD4E|nr:cohesin subunit SA-3-like [Catharus ustulatus]